MLENLKILNLSHSLDLTETPEFSYIPNLEKLVLKDCPKLSKVSHSIGSLQKLLLVNLTYCTGLRELPKSIYKIKSLETLILSGCSMIEELEEDLEQMESLTTLIADKTAIKKVAFSILRSKSIGYISLGGLEGFSRDVLPSLIWSWISPSNNVIVQSSVSMSSHGTFADLPKLRYLCVECGSQLQLTQDVARFLDVLKATNCQNWEASASSITSQDIDGCLRHLFTSGSKNPWKSFLIQMGKKCQLSNTAEDSILQIADGTSDSFLLPRDYRSYWLTFSCEGCSVIFDVPTMEGRNLKSFIFVVCYPSLETITWEGCQGVLIINHTKTTVQVYKRDTLTSFDDEDWQTITSNLESGNKVEVRVVSGEGFIVEKTTISLLYDEPVDKEMESCCVVDKDDFVSGNDSGDVAMEANMNFAVSCGSGSDIQADKNVSISGEDENVSDNNNEDLVDNDDDASGEPYKKVIVSAGDQNRFCSIFVKLPSLIRDVLISRPFWSGLIGILVWITYHRFKKGRSPNLLPRYTRRVKWLVDCAQKLITYKKANGISKS